MAKFEVGDKVMVVKLDLSWYACFSNMGHLLGKTGVIIESDCNGEDSFYIYFDDCRKYYHLKPDWLELVEKKKKGWNGKVVCVKSHRPNMDLFTVGKVSDVVDGKIFDNSGTFYNGADESAIRSLKDLLEMTESFYDFIVFKGFADKKGE